MTWEEVIVHFSGLAWVAPEVEPASLLRAVALVHLLDGIMCRVIAGNHGRSRPLAFLLGLGFGVWAVAAYLVLPSRKRESGAVGSTRQANVPSGT